MTPRARKIAKHLNRAPEIGRCFLHSRDWLKMSFSYTGLRPHSFPYVARFRDGSSFEFRDLPDVATWWQIFYRNIYPIKKTDRVIVDAGANIGAFTLYAASRSPAAKIIAIEPFPDTFSRLQSAVERSAFGHRIQLINAALGSETGWLTMQQGDVGSQFRRVVEAGSQQAGVRVRSCTLSEILDAHDEIDFLKMDIEGSEYPSILACPAESLRRVRRLAMEFHPIYTARAPQPRDLFQHLEKTGLTLTEVQDHGEGYGMAYLRRH